MQLYALLIDTGFHIFQRMSFSRPQPLFIPGKLKETCFPYYSMALSSSETREACRGPRRARD